MHIVFAVMNLRFPKCQYFVSTFGWKLWRKASVDTYTRFQFIQIAYFISRTDSLDHILEQFMMVRYSLNMLRWNYWLPRCLFFIINNYFLLCNYTQRRLHNAFMSEMHLYKPILRMQYWTKLSRRYVLTIANAE